MSSDPKEVGRGDVQVLSPGLNFAPIRTLETYSMIYKCLESHKFTHVYFNTFTFTHLTC